MAASTASTSLTETDREILDQARHLCKIRGMAALREHTGYDDSTMALAAAWGEAKYLLGELAAIVEQLSR